MAFGPQRISRSNILSAEYRGAFAFKEILTAKLRVSSNCREVSSDTVRSYDKISNESGLCMS